MEKCSRKNEAYLWKSNLDMKREVNQAKFKLGRAFNDDE
jgi:hypothetical protein